MRHVSYFLASALLLGCRPTTQVTSNNAVSSATNTAAADYNVAVTPAAAPDCTAGMRGEIDQESFSPGLGKPIAKEQLAAFLPQAEQAFKTAASELCKSGDIPADHVRAYHRLLIQHGSGANSTAVYGDDDETITPHDRLVFQYLFDDGEGHLDLPPADDIRAGILCWFSEDEKYQKTCAEREP